MEDIISIIVPVFNVESYLPRCLETVTAQTYSNIEIILVDDGSTDSSGVVCDKFAERDRRVIVIHQKNQGLAKARNNGVKQASGKYILFVDGDDFIHPQLTEILYSTLVAEPDCNISMVKGKKVNKEDRLPSNTIGASAKLMNQEDFIKGLFGGYNTNWQFAAVWNKLYPKSLIESIPFTEMNLEDLFFNVRVAIHIDKVAYKGDELYFWVMRPGSITRNGISKRYVEMVSSYLKMLTYLPENNQKYRSFCLIKLYKRMMSVRMDVKGTHMEEYANSLIKEAECKTFKDLLRNTYISTYQKVILIVLYKIPILYVIFRRIKEFGQK